LNERPQILHVVLPAGADFLGPRLALGLLLC